MARRRIDVNDIVEVLVHWQAGRSVKQIARSTGLARNTVRKYLAMAAGAGVRRQPVLDRSVLSALVGRACPELLGEVQTELWEELRGCREEIVEGLKESTMATVWQRLRDAGRLRGSIATFRRYVRGELKEVDPDRVAVRRPPAELGEAAEIDFGVLGIWVDPRTGSRRRIWAFVMVLGASRHMFVRPVWSLDLKTWIRCHVEAFEFFGSVPRRWVLDNLKDGVVKASLYDPQLNRTYAELAQHFGALADPCRSSRPTDKPVVERMMPYVRDSFWSGRDFASFEEIVRAAPIWCLEVAGVRQHRTLRARPLDVFELEREAMLPLPASGFEVVGWYKARVQRDIHLNCAGALYSVPWRLVGRWLQIRLGENTVEVFDGEELVKVHPRVAAGQRQTDWADYPPTKAAFFVRNAPWCQAQARLLGPGVTEIVEALLVDGALYNLRQAQGIVRLAESYPAERLEAACRLATEADGQLMTVRNLLRTGRDQASHQLDPERANTSGAFLHGRELMLAGAIQ
jgi:transposase